MIVVSTAYDPPAEINKRCLTSVEWQTGVNVAHIYIDAANQSPPKAHFENLLEATAAADPNDIIVALDGDDWLAYPNSLQRVQDEYDEHPETLVTYGSYLFADGRPGHARELTQAEWAMGPRKAPWVTTHLKTFRAGLLRRIAREHLTYEGQWLEHARDLALMFPMLEMAGPDRSRFIPEVLYVYNYANSTEFRGDAAMLAAEREQVRYVRSLPPYTRLP